MGQDTPIIRIDVYDENGGLLREQTFEQNLIRIGKGGQSHLRLGNSTVSRQHAVIEVDESGRVLLRDLESTNGTQINGKRLKEGDLYDGDEIRIGDARLIIHIEGGKPAAKRVSDRFYIYSKEDDETGPGTRPAIEVTILWKDELVDIRYIKRGEQFTIGNSDKVDYLLPEEFIKDAELALVSTRNNAMYVDVSPKEAMGDAMVDGEILPLDRLKRKAILDDNNYLQIKETTRARIKFGDFTFLVRYVEIPPLIKPSPWRTIDWSLYTFLILSLVLHMMFLLMVNMIPEEELQAMSDPYKISARAFKMIQFAEKDKEEIQKKEAEKKKKAFIANKIKTDQNGNKTKKPKTDKLISKLTPEQKKQRDKKVAMSSGLTRVLSQNDMLTDIMGEGPGTSGMGIKVIGSAGGPGTSSMGLFGGIMGPGGSGGFAGPGMGLGAGGQFAAAGTGIKGLEKTSSGGVGVNMKKRARNTRLYLGNPDISGHLDKEIVRRYIHRHMDQIRWCYQQEVQKNPKLEGDVKMSFVITPSGRVIRVKVAETTLRNTNVEQCMVERIGTWQFPAPKGGGLVKVVYPFILRVTR